MSARRVVVTGGASGIGRATVLRLAAQGASVAALDIDEALGRELAAAAGGTGAIEYLRADVSSEEETEEGMAEAVRRLGGLDVLVTAAGIMRGQLQPLIELDALTWEEVLEVNLRGTLHACKAAARYMLPRGRGVMILLASRAGVVVGSGSYPYGASKGGIHGLALTLERHLGPSGIRVHDVCPGDVDTPLYRGSLAEGVRRGGDPGVAEAMARSLTAAEDVAEVLAFLASENASAVRGTIYTA